MKSMTSLFHITVAKIRNYFMDWTLSKNSISIDRNMIQVLCTEAKYLIFKVNKKQFRQAHSHMEIICAKYTVDLSDE